MCEESHLALLRRLIEEQYETSPTGCGNSFGEILCYEIHEGGLTFEWLAEKWGVSLATLGELIHDHCKRLEPLPRVDHLTQRIIEAESVAAFETRAQQLNRGRRALMRTVQNYNKVIAEHGATTQG